MRHMRAVGRIRLRRGIFSAAWRKIFKRGLGATSAESAANGKITDKIAFKPRENSNLVALMRSRVSNRVRAIRIAL